MKRLLVAFLLSFSLGSPAFATEVKEVVSPGGIKAWLVEEHALPLVAVKIVFKDSGFAYDPASKEGRANMTSALLMEGAGDLDSRAFNEALENSAIQLNFGTDEDLLRASVESLSEHKEKAFSYLAMALTKPRFDSDAIERVRSQTLSIIKRQEQQPGYLVHRGWQKLAFGAHAYGNPFLGTKESVAKLGKSDLSDFARRYITRENMLVAVVGDITPADLGRLLDAHLAGLPARYDPDVKVKDMQLPQAAQQIVIDNDIPQSMIMFGAQGVKRDDPNYFAAYVMNYILGGNGSLSSKLSQEIREKRGLTYSVNTQIDPMIFGASWHGGFSTRNAEVGKALETLRTTLKEYAENGPSDTDMADAKKYLTGSFVLGLDSNSDIANYLISMQLYNLGRDYLDKRNSLIKAVKKEDVKKMAAQLLTPDKLLVVIVGKPTLDVKP